MQLCSPDDSILLLENGVLAALTHHPYSAQLTSLMSAGVKVFALGNDIMARGIESKIRADITLTDYQGFVQLSTEHTRVQSWY